jgi:iron complex outermembrane recepter protein
MQVDNEVTNVATLGDRGVFQNANTDRQGVEAGIVVDLMEGLRLTTSYTYSDFKFDRFPSDPTLVGDRLPSVPRHLVYNELAYTHESGLYVIGDVLWVDDYFADNANTAVNPSYAVATIRFGRDFDFGNLRLAPFLGVNNLFDEKYNGNVRPNSFGGRYFEPAPERNVYGGLTARYSF